MSEYKGKEVNLTADGKRTDTAEEGGYYINLDSPEQKALYKIMNAFREAMRVPAKELYNSGKKEE